MSVTGGSPGYPICPFPSTVADCGGTGFIAFKTTHTGACGGTFAEVPIDGAHAEGNLVTAPAARKIGFLSKFTPRFSQSCALPSLR